MIIKVDRLRVFRSKHTKVNEVGEKQNNMWCHLYVTPVTKENLLALHNFAKKIGLKKQWFQNNTKSLPHYDLVPTKRELAIKNGAKSVEDKELIADSREYRKTQFSINSREPV